MNANVAEQTCASCGKRFAVPNADALPALPTKCLECEQGGKLTEQEAIAAAKVIGERMRQEDRGPIYWYAKRIGIAAVVLGIAGLVMLLGYTKLTRAEGTPIFGMLLLAGFSGAGAVLSYWGHVESKRSGE